jgi:hypothetical protein
LGTVSAPGAGLEEGLLLEAAQAGDEAGREHAHAEVVVAHRLVEALALHGDAVLRPLELALEGEEVLVALELRIALHGDEEAREGAPELVLGILELLESARVVEELRGGLDAAALARAWVTSSRTVRSWVAKPLTVSTRLGMRSARRW